MLASWIKPFRQSHRRPGRRLLVAGLCVLLGACRSAGTIADADGAPDAAPAADLSFADGSSPTDLRAELDGEEPADARATQPPGDPCADADYAGWRCHALSIVSDRHGQAAFSIAVRYNLAAATAAASALWVMGSNGSGKFRVQYNVAPVQDELATQDAIRSIEVEFTDPPDAGAYSGGYFRQPRQGYVDAAWVYARAVRELKALGIATGSWLTHIGISNGSMIGAAALAHHQLDADIRRYVLLSGPFAADLEPECTDGGFYAFMGNTSPAAPDIRQLVDLWNGWTDVRSCELGLPNPDYAARSVLGPTGQSVYGSVSIAVLVGDADEFGPWLLASNDNWYNRVTAASKRRYLLDGRGHLVLGSEGDPASEVIATLHAYAKMPPLQEPGAKPILTFSRTPGGPPAATFSTSETLHGRVAGIGPAAEACMEHAPTSRGQCATLDGWTPMPNADWTYSAATGEWTAAVPLSAFPSGVYYGWWRNSQTGQLTDRVEIVVQ